jgi:hypothetical protein
MAETFFSFVLRTPRETRWEADESEIGGEHGTGDLGGRCEGRGCGDNTTDPALVIPALVVTRPHG